MKLAGVVVLGAMTGLLAISAAFVRAAQEPSSEDYQAQSEYLRSFADFIDWSPSRPNRTTRETISFCVLGRDPYGNLLDKSVLGHPVGERPTIIARGQHFEDLGTCDILFISSSEVKHEAKIFEHLRNKEVLTVGNSEDFAARGGVIQFVINEGHVGFLINVDAAQRDGVRIRASLLALAKIVHDDRNKDGG